MKIRTKQERIENASNQWDIQYDSPNISKVHKKIGEELKKNKIMTAEKIEEIIGNDSWTKNQCLECGEDSEILIHLGEEIDYDSISFLICPNCLQKALKLAIENP